LILIVTCRTVTVITVFQFEEVDLSMPLNETHLKGKPVHLIFHADPIKNCMISSIVLTSTESHYNIPLPIKIDYEKLSLYFAFRPHDVI
jgi:hypothetical protein